jgi:hypothetical protein
VRRAHRNLRRNGVYADQVSLAAVDPRTHFVKALVGGINYDKSQFNRAIQARRQPGSAFKPFVYYTAFATGKYSPSSTSWILRLDIVMVAAGTLPETMGVATRGHEHSVCFDGISECPGRKNRKNSRTR